MKGRSVHHHQRSHAKQSHAMVRFALLGNRSLVCLIGLAIVASTCGCRTGTSLALRSPAAKGSSTASVPEPPVSAAEVVATSPTPSLPSSPPSPVIPAGFEAGSPTASKPPANASLSDQTPSTSEATPSPSEHASSSPAAEPTALSATGVRCPDCPVPAPAASPSQVLDQAARGVGGPGWRPPGFVGPWPRDEYICDGGDTFPRAGVTGDGRAVGLQNEDTIVQYRTVDGQARIQASNRVCIYAPRFAAVRKVYRTVLLDQHEAVAGVDQPVGLKRIDDTTASNTFVQPLQPGRYFGTKNASRLLKETRPEPIDNVEAVAETESQWLPYEDLNIIRRGVMDNSEKARLAAKLQAAIVWSNPQAVQVVIDGQLAAEASGRTEAAEVRHYKLPDGKRRLRIVKIADRRDAQPGDIIAFTIRVDNVGDLPVQNAIIVDELSPRLELVEESQQCSLRHDFSAKPNRAGSVTLRWDVRETIPVGEGFVIRFRCRVR